MRDGDQKPILSQNWGHISGTCSARERFVGERSEGSMKRMRKLRAWIQEGQEETYILWRFKSKRFACDATGVKPQC